MRVVQFKLVFLIFHKKLYFLRDLAGSKNYAEVSFGLVKKSQVRCATMHSSIFSLKQLQFSEIQK
jgi:hypothetical protein